jgi:hypothetical protein
MGTWTKGSLTQFQKRIATFTHFSDITFLLRGKSDICYLIKYS